MIRPYRLFVGLGLLFLVLVTSSWGQPGKTEGGPSNLYNPDAVVTVSGIVIAKNPPSSKGLPQLVYLTLRTKTEKITIFLGPSVAIDKFPLKIQALDKIEVTGSKVNWEGKPVIIAAEIKKGDQVLKLRDPNGVPVWSGQGKTNP